VSIAKNDWETEHSLRIDLAKVLEPLICTIRKLYFPIVLFKIQEVSVLFFRLTSNLSNPDNIHYVMILQKRLKAWH